LLLATLFKINGGLTTGCDFSQNRYKSPGDRMSECTSEK